MRKLAIVLLTLLLAGCGGGGSDQANDVLSAVKKGCSFELDYSSAAAMLAAAAGQGAAAVGVKAIADAVCSAVVAHKSGIQTLTGDCPLGTVNGVCIKRAK